MGDVLEFLGFIVFFGAGAVWVMQLMLLPVAIKTSRRKGIAPGYCWWLVVPYAGIVTAYWIACAERKTA
jgi:hypothetical protein